MRPILFASLLVLAGCAGPATLHAPDGDPYMTGTVTELRLGAVSRTGVDAGVLTEPDQGAASSILLEPLSQFEADCEVIAAVDAQTRYFRLQGEETTLVGVGTTGARSLSPGRRVEVFMRGPVSESCPQRGRASAFVLID